MPLADRLKDSTSQGLSFLPFPLPEIEGLFPRFSFSFRLGFSVHLVVGLSCVTAFSTMAIWQRLLQLQNARCVPRMLRFEDLTRTPTNDCPPPRKNSLHFPFPHPRQRALSCPLRRPSPLPYGSPPITINPLNFFPESLGERFSYLPNATPHPFGLSTRSALLESCLLVTQVFSIRSWYSSPS